MKKPATCHPNRPARATGLCRSCYAKNFYKNRPDYAERRREAVKRWRAKNPEWAKNLDLEKHLRKKFGITAADYHKINDAQKGLCKICQKPETTRVRGNLQQRLAVDHCHKTGIIRGLLCFKCNTSIAIIESNLELIDTIKIYLGKDR